MSNMSHNGLPVLLALLLLLLKYSSAETSAVSSTSPTSTVSTTSTTGKAASTRSATEEYNDWKECVERQCDNVTCAECMPQDESCALSCRRKCRCACRGYEIDGTDLGLFLECSRQKDCDAKYFPAVLACRDEECSNKHSLDMFTCDCECLPLTRAQASVAVAITATTTCTRKEYYGRCYPKCNDEWQLFKNECGDEGWKCQESRKRDCLCRCAGHPSTTHYTPANKSEYKESCDGECRRTYVTCLQDLRIRGIGYNEELCDAYNHKCQCACQAGAANSTDAAEYRTATEDRMRLELCAWARSCHNATCGCLEGDEECVSQCRDSCRCRCLSFPADGPGGQRAQPAGGRLTVSQCRDRREACLASCAGDTGCKDWCYLEKEVCDCRCAGRSIPPSPKKIATIPTDTGDKPTVMYCNYLN